MIVRIDPASAVPPYEQLRAQIAAMIASGVVPEGSRLPPIRQLARDLVVAEGTVARAFRELEREGWLETRRRHGSFARRPDAGLDPDIDEALRRAASEFALRVAQAGASRERALSAAQLALDAVLGAKA
jgi:DNA-binding transcriptional regulator YhcF (GntR family)